MLGPIKTSGGGMSSATRRTRAASGLALCSLALWGVGCGSSGGSSSTSNRAYKSSVTNAATPWTAAAQHFSTAAQSTNVQTDLASIDGFIVANTAFANRLATIKPPAAATSAHAGLISALRKLSTGLGNLKHVAQVDIRTHNTTGLKAAETQVVTDLEGVRSTTQTLQAKVA
jgi:hypothetical protein